MTPYRRTVPPYPVPPRLKFPELASLQPDLQQKLVTIRTIWERGIKKWRNQWLSHRDTDVAMGITQLPDVPFPEIKELVAGISDFAHEIDHRLNQVSQSYSVGVYGWVPNVLDYLKRGIAAKDKELEEYRERFEPKKPNPDD